MFESIRADAKRYFAIDGWARNSFVGYAFVLFFSYGLQSTVIYRFGKVIEIFKDRFYTLPFYWILNCFYLLLYWLSKKLHGIDICRGAEIGKGFYIGHFGGIKVSHCKIGDMCNIHQLTNIGDNVIIGNYVWIGAHAVVEDGVVVADNATVTVAARVSKPVSSYTLVAGAPARTIKINFDNTKMLRLNNETQKIV